MPRVSIEGINQTFDVNEGEILYDSLIDRGHELPHGCLAGSCGACRVEVISGKESLTPPTFIEQNTIESLKEEFKTSYGENFVEGKEIRLSCRAKLCGQNPLLIKPIT